MLLHPFQCALLFFFIILFSSPNDSQSLTTNYDDEEERAILLSLKQHWGNPSSLHHWNSTSTLCDWPHISCNFSGSVEQINLRGMNLSGTIPVGLSTCSKLEKLDLSGNHLTGKIPGELFSMKTLRSLYLQENMLSGAIPTPVVAYRLEYLDLSDNQLNGSIPEDIGNLYHLGYLNLSRNSLSGPIPSRLSRLHQLSQISLDFNNLTGEIPGEIFSMKTLGSLSLHHNMLSGEVPTPKVAYTLYYLDLSSNNLNGSIREDIGNLYRLVYLDLSMNSFGGPIPATLLRSMQLSYLSLASNNLTGEIPSTLGLSSLSHIDLSHNHLNGTIPASLGDLQKLVDVDISNNQLSGDIWVSVRRLRVRMNICMNNLSGRIPNKLVKERFADSCFDEANLCSYVKDKGLPACSTERCSDDTIRYYINCSSKPSKSKKKDYSAIIVGVGLPGLIILVLVIIYPLARYEGERRGGKDREGENDGEEWSMTSFQRLEFNKWEILGGLTDENLIGKGGSGKVYRVVTRKGQRVAVKSIRHERKQGHILEKRFVAKVKILWHNIVKVLCCMRRKSVWHEEKQRLGLMEKQFLAEVKILGGIKHNNIVKLLCCIRGKTTKLIVYEYMDKQCLHNWLHGNNKVFTTQVLQWERRLKIAIGAAQGLCYMHHNRNPPILHRDIKSSNILVDTDFNAKIADFGLAKMLASEEDPETASAIVGTFGYIAPEYFSSTKVNVKSDIYSFGVVLLELTTGREAVSANEEINLAQWAHKHIREGNSAADALCEEIKDPRYREAATTVFKLGLASTLSSPSSRLSMKDILQILQRCSENNHMSS